MRGGEKILIETVQKNEDRDVLRRAPGEETTFCIKLINFEADKRVLGRGGSQKKEVDQGAFA